MTMIERVAKAVREADIISLGRREDLPIEAIRRLADECQPDYEAMARAAIEAMQHPTQSMLDSGFYPAVQRRGAKSVWQEMILAALNEVE